MVRFFSTRVLLVAMVSLLLGVGARLSAQSPEAAEDIRGPKALVEIPQPQKPPVALWLGIAGGALVLGAAWFWWRKRRARQRHSSPQETALAALTELAAGRVALTAEAFANRAANIVRQYIAGRFGLAAPRRTTEEFLREISRDAAADLTGESDHLRAFLKACDLAKFAGARLDAAQRDDLLQTARAFIGATATQQPKLKEVAP
jgi:LPXTG-motif cell wall-anchored protein